jgi:ubiquitin-large subunit ribosomal protein L40e
MGKKTKGSTVYRSSHNHLLVSKELDKYKEDERIQEMQYVKMKMKNRRKPIMVSAVIRYTTPEPNKWVCGPLVSSRSFFSWTIFHPRKIDVQIQSGRKITITVSPDDTLDDVRDKISMKEGISPDQQVLMLNGIRLMNGGNLEELGVIESATLFLTLRNWGG